MTKRAFDKIRAGLDSARAYLGGSADKAAYRVHVSESLDETGPGVESLDDGPPRPARRLQGE